MATAFDAALAAMRQRVLQTASSALPGFPHYADQTSGAWTTTPDAFWTGGFWLGELWLVNAKQPEPGLRDQAEAWLNRLSGRVESRTVFRGFLFLYGAALGADLSGSPRAKELAIAAARSLASTFDERAGLMPLGVAAEENHTVSDTDTNIDGLTASPLLLWASDITGDADLRRIALSHARRNANYCVREDGSVVQSASFDASTGELLRQFTHKGSSDNSVWTRAQAWAMLGYSLCAGMAPEESDMLELVTRVCDWWLDHAPSDHVAYWDFDVPQNETSNRDTSGTAIAAAALLKAADLVGDVARKEAYRSRAEAMVDALVRNHLNVGEAPIGLLRDGCFDKRAGMAESNELIWGSYYLLESLCVLSDGLGGRSKVLGKLSDLNFSLEGLVGTAVTVEKTITERDLLGFAEISGDSHPNHTDEKYSKKAGLGGRVAQGALLVGLIAGASTRYLTEIGHHAVSYGYDRVRFLKLVLIGDQLTIEYRITQVDLAKSNASAEARLVNQRGELVAVGINILHFT